MLPPSLRRACVGNARTIAIILAAALSGAPLSAQVAADSATGFAIALADSFSVHRTTNRPQFDVGFGIRAKGDSETDTAAGSGGFLCEAGFKSAPQNASLTRDQINALVDNPDWRNLVRANLNMIFDIVTEEAFTLQGYRGVELTLRPKGGAGSGFQLFMSLVETARGRMTMVCNGSAAGMPTALPGFRAIRQGVRLPE